jgi:hypothetical protein
VWFVDPIPTFLLALDVLEDPFFFLLLTLEPVLVVVVDDLFPTLVLDVLDDPFALFSSDEIFSLLKISRALNDRPVCPFALDDVVFLDDPFLPSDDGD